MLNNNEIHKIVDKMRNVSLVDGHIDEPKLTDEQIIKALEYCINNNGCNGCEFTGHISIVECMKLFYDLINRQKAEIEELDKANLQLMAILQTAQSEARKEFANKLKRMCEKDGFVDRYDIMRLLKEMEGE